METHIVIMAGGVGSRLWPISTPDVPKQFIDVLGVGKTLIQMTMDRFRPVASPSDFWVVTGEKYVSMVREQLPEIPSEQVLAEPEPRNTAPCIAYACKKIAKRHPDANVVVTPADALVLNTAKFTQDISLALETVSETNRIVTIGISPTRPETGYGYIKAASAEKDKVLKVSEFKEKPDLATAKRYLAAGNYFWNAGIFVWNVKTISAALRTYTPEIMDIMDRLEPKLYTDEESTALRYLFPQCPKISIDYAVMEKSPDIYVIASELGWSDLGTWGSLGKQIPADNEGNSVVGDDVRLYGCKGCIVHAGDVKTVIVSGLSDFIIAEKNGRVLVCPKSDEQHIREYSQAGKNGGKS
jgi:mannose-1-phosphate guanylyltransferase